MIDQLIEWVKGMFGGAAEEMTQGVTDTLGAGAGGVAEAAQSYGEDAAGDAVAGAEEAIGGAAEETVGGAAETVQGVQEGADTVSGAIEDPGAAATDYLRGGNE